MIQALFFFKKEEESKSKVALQMESGPKCCVTVKQKHIVSALEYNHINRFSQTGVDSSGKKCDSRL